MKEKKPYHKLLDRQIRKYLSQDCVDNEHFAQFIDKVNESYNNFDRSTDLALQSSQINEQEYLEINKRLKKELEEKEKTQQKLLESIKTLNKSFNEGETEEVYENSSVDDLLRVLDKAIQTKIRLEEELIQAILRAEDASRAKSDFLSVISHEIRTPLNAIIGMAYIMNNDDTNYKENLDTLKQSALNLNNLINDILDLSKIEFGGLTIESLPFNLKNTILHIIKANDAKINDSGNTLNFYYDPNLTENYIGDSLRISQIFTNLINNASKFTTNGTIDIRVTPVKREGNLQTILVQVKDTGIGISEEEQKIIFDKFTQAETKTTRNFGGTGLGLTIVREILMRMNTNIFVKSEKGKGSEFYFELTMEIDNNPQNTTEEVIQERSQSSLKDKKVLLVEDFPANILVAKKILDKWNMIVDVAENGKIALDKFVSGKYDVILMDIQMPVMDGYECTQEIRKIDTRIPIIALTASVFGRSKGKAELSGMSDYISKPFNPSELFLKLEKATTAL